MRDVGSASDGGRFEDNVYLGGYGKRECILIVGTKKQRVYKTHCYVERLIYSSSNICMDSKEQFPYETVR